MSQFVSFSDNVGLAVRLVVPYTLMAVLYGLNLVSLPHVFVDLAELPFFLITIYYWSLYRPTLIPVWLVFLSGLVMDLLSGVPLGLHAFIFVLVRWSVTRQRRFLTGQTFLMVWLAFVFVFLASLLLQWGMMSLSSMTVFPLHDLALSLVAGVFIFPVITMMLHLTHKMLPVSSV